MTRLYAVQNSRENYQPTPAIKTTYFVDLRAKFANGGGPIFEIPTDTNDVTKSLPGKCLLSHRRVERFSLRKKKIQLTNTADNDHRFQPGPSQAWPQQFVLSSIFNSKIAESKVKLKRVITNALIRLTDGCKYHHSPQPIGASVDISNPLNFNEKSPHNSIFSLKQGRRNSYLLCPAQGKATLSRSH